MNECGFWVRKWFLSMEEEFLSSESVIRLNMVTAF